jgi:major membrane immunogen (membrane-anchored lipoprotein)
MAQENLNIRIRAFDKTRSAFRAVNAGLGQIRKTVFSTKAAITGLAGAAGLGLLVKSTIETNQQFQSLEATLKTFLGSSERAAQAFDVLKTFAAQTPFSVQEVTKSFNILLAQGITPSIKALDAFGNIASGSGKSLQQFSEAVTDAVQGEFERLKEFGIKASKEGERITFTFGGVQTEVKNSAEEIQGFLETLGRTEFAGATAEQARTLTGAFSNLGDAFDAFKVAIGEAGFNKSINDFARALSELVRNSPDVAEAIGKKLAGAVNFFTGILKKGESGITAFAASLSIQVIDSVRRTLVTLQDLANGVDETVNRISFGLVGTGKLDFSDTTFGLAELSEKLKATAEAAGMSEGGVALTIQQMDEQLKKATDGVGKASGTLTVGQKALKDYADAAKDVKANLESAALRGVKSLEDALVGVVTGATSAKDAFRSMAQSIIADLARLAIQKAITGPIASAFGLTGKAIGGSVQRGRPVMVGERGAELFVPSSSGSIVSNKNLAGAGVGGGGITVNQTINVTTGVQQTVRSEIVNLMPQIANATKAAVADSRLRGGSFSKAFGG